MWAGTRVAEGPGGRWQRCPPCSPVMGCVCCGAPSAGGVLGTASSALRLVISASGTVPWFCVTAQHLLRTCNDSLLGLRLNENGDDDQNCSCCFSFKVLTKIVQNVPFPHECLSAACSRCNGVLCMPNLDLTMEQAASEELFLSHVSQTENNLASS